MSILYLDCQMGAAGDMLTAALLELLPDPDGFLDSLNRIGIEGVRFKAEKATKCGILATQMHVLVHGEEEDEHSHSEVHIHEEDHYHEHGHRHHHHSSLQDIEEKIERLFVPDKVKKDIKAVYRILGEAESMVHGVPMTDIHFHEIGTMDALADITAVCMLIRTLSPSRILCSPIHVGSGTVKCAHGILPVPAPATALILKGIPVYSAEIKGELCTPTGAALLKYFVDEFTQMPPMKITSVGYGIGKKDFERLNCVRAILGEEEELQDSISELICNIDDMTGEDLGFAMERILESGARDVYTIPVTMKKSRPGVQLCAICSQEEKEAVLKAIFTHTSTIGIREACMNRYVLKRETVPVETPYGILHKKVSSGYGVSKEKAEYEEIASAALEYKLDLKTVRKSVEQEKND